LEAEKYWSLHKVERKMGSFWGTIFNKYTDEPF
jgi:hypothetical protein